MVIDEIHKVLQAQAPLEHAGSVVLRKCAVEVFLLFALLSSYAPET